MEVWKDIKGYEGLYQVSNLGRVKSLTKKDSVGREIKGKILTLIQNQGYYRISLCKNGKVCNKLVHRLVADAFIPNPDNKPHIDHINTIKTDNKVDNIRWVTIKENNENPLSLSHRKRGDNHPKPFKGRVGKSHPTSKPIIQLSKDGEFIKIWESINIANTHYNTSHISDCCGNKRNFCRGFKWGYLDDYEQIPFKIFNLELYRKKAG